MELLIYNKAHWMDALSGGEVTTRAAADPTFQAKYDARVQSGDIWETRPDGTYTGKDKQGYDTGNFRLILISGMPVDSTYEQSSTNYRRRYNTQTGAGIQEHTVLDIGLVDITDKEA
jgi:hypothetical protein